MALLQAAALQCRPQSFRAEFTKHTGRHLRFAQLALPLSDDGKSVNMLLCGFEMEKAYGRTGRAAGQRVNQPLIVR